MEIKENWPLQSLTTMGVDASCRFFAEAGTKEEIQALLSDAEFAGIPRFFLGGGSNTLFVGDYPGLVVRIANRGIEVTGEDERRVQVRVQAGEKWTDFVRLSLQEKWWGAENLSGIPGSVGGAVAQNMGAYGVEIAQLVERVEFFDTVEGKFGEVPVKECGYRYRGSRFKDQERYIVWSAVLSLSKAASPCLEYEGLRDLAKDGIPDQEAIALRIEGLRRMKLPEPGQIGSVGSFFTNPAVDASRYSVLEKSYPGIPGHVSGKKVKLSAAWLIEQCGWKGYREGDAGVYGKQPLVLVNYGNATGEDIWDLAARVRESVRKKFWVELEPEVCVVNGKERQADMRYEEILGKMFRSLPMFQRIGAAAYKPDLNNTLKLMSALNEPFRKFRSVHVAGTNGKGSCAHMLASVFQAAGYKTGLYTSPHLRDFRERIRINGEEISKEEVVDFYQEHEELFRKVKSSFFEMTVAMAFDYFARQRVDMAIVEVGMGGRLDSTNVISPELSLITNISMDHMQFLGDTLARIAEEKAGIIKPGTPVVIGESQIQTRMVFDRKAKECRSAITYADTVFTLQNVRNDGLSFTFDACKYGEPYLTGLSCDLMGDTYECKNIVSCLCALDQLRKTYDIPDQAIREGLAHAASRTGLSGRWQRIGVSPLAYCDTGHNEAGIRLVLQQISKIPYQRLHIVWGMVKDKDIDAILGLLPRSAAYYFCQAPQERALDARLLQQKAESFGLKGKVYPSVQAALAEARSQAKARDLIYVGGSTFVVAEIC